MFMPMTDYVIVHGYCTGDMKESCVAGNTTEERFQLEFIAFRIISSLPLYG